MASARAMRDALLLAAGQLRRIVMAAVRSARPPRAARRSRAASRRPGDLHRHADVLERRQRRNQVEELEDEADLLAAQPRQRVLAERVMSHAVDEDRRPTSARRGRRSGRAASTCRCPTARRSPRTAPRATIEIERMQDGQRLGRRSCTVFETPRSSIMCVGRSGASRDRLQAGQTLSATMRAPFGVGMDAVAPGSAPAGPPRPRAGTARSATRCCAASSRYTCAKRATCRPRRSSAAPPCRRAAP